MFFGGSYHVINSQEINEENVLTEFQKKYTVKIFKTNSVGIPTFIEGDLTPFSANGDEINISYIFFQENQRLFQMGNPRQELIVKKVKKDELGMTHVTFNQLYKGIEVYGGELIVHFSSTKRIKSVNGFYKPGIKIPTTPTIPQVTSENIALVDLEKNLGRGDITDTRLMIYEYKEIYYLIWKVMLKIESPIGSWEYFIDANSGDILYKANRIKFQSSSFLDTIQKTSTMELFEVSIPNLQDQTQQDDATGTIMEGKPAEQLSEVEVPLRKQGNREDTIVIDKMSGKSYGELSEVVAPDPKQNNVSSVSPGDNAGESSPAVLSKDVPPGPILDALELPQIILDEQRE
jgi:Zn-dependent metalloprotease